MEKLKALEGAARKLSITFFSPSNFWRKKIRNLLPVTNPDTLILKIETDTEKVQSAKEVQLEIQRFQVGLSRIIRFFLFPEPMANSHEKDSEFDKCLKMISSAVNLIITNCMGEYENFLIVEENDCSNSNNLALPEYLPPLTLQLNVPSTSKKRNVNISSGDIGTQTSAVLQKDQDKNDGISKKKPKPKTPMELAFANDVVLLEIFRHCKATDLKRFRLVNRKWNETATSTLLIKKSLQLTLSKLVKERRGLAKASGQKTSPHFSSQVRLKNGSVGSLTDLFCLVKSSGKFPTQSLTFKNNYNYVEFHPQVQQLLQIFGNQLKELTFLCSGEISTRFLQELLSDVVPNLESLIIRDCTLVRKKKPLPTTDLDRINTFEVGRIPLLPHLKQLVFLPFKKKFNLAGPKSSYPLHMEFFKELVNAAVNLCSVYTRSVDFLEVLLDLGKVQLVKKVGFKPQTEEEERLGGTVKVNLIAIYKKLASMKPEIRTLSVNFGFLREVEDPREIRRLDPKRSKFEAALNSVLESAKDSLCDLKLQIQPNFSINLPVFPNVKKLEISEDPFEDELDLGAVLPAHSRSLSFQRNFPHLHEVHLGFCSYLDLDLKRDFPGQLKKWVNPTVKHLTFRGNMSDHGNEGTDRPYKGPQLLGKMFPNVTSVIIIYDLSAWDNGDMGDTDNSNSDDEKIQQLSNIIWHQIPAGVKSISVTGLDATYLNKDNVDTYFTGMTNKMCQKLRKFPQRIGGGSGSVVLDELRTKPSICVFKNLEELNISCDHFRSDHRFVSHITGLYAFDLMPQLKVTVTYEPRPFSRPAFSWKEITTPAQDMKHSLKHIAPYITQVCHQKQYY